MGFVTLWMLLFYQAITKDYIWLQCCCVFFFFCLFFYLLPLGDFQYHPPFPVIYSLKEGYERETFWHQTISIISHFPTQRSVFFFFFFNVLPKSVNMKNRFTPL